MVKEIIEQEFLQKLFFSWYDFMPVDINDIETMIDRATAALQQQFYSKSKGSSAGSTNGAHAALGTRFRSPQCTVGEYAYDKKGAPIKDANGEHQLNPMTEEEYMKAHAKSSCEALVRAPYIHEQYHQKTCQELNAAGKQSKWDSLEFFARNDSEAYKAGVDYLRQQTKALALKCGWKGSTGPNARPDAVPTPKDAKKLAKNGGKIVKGRSGGKKSSIAPIDHAIAIITGVAVRTDPLESLIAEWDQSCANQSSSACDGLVTSIEVGLYDLLRAMKRSGEDVDRETLVYLAHAELPLLKHLALWRLRSAQSPEEIALAMEAADDPSPAVRQVAEYMLQSVDDPRWIAMKHWRKESASSAEDNLTAGLVPELSPHPGQFALKSFDDLRFRYFASTKENAVFTTREPLDKVLKRMSQGRQVMQSADALQQSVDNVMPKMQAMQKEMMAAASSGDQKKLSELIQKMTELQKQIPVIDPQALNPTKNSTAIVLAKAADGRPTSTATLQRDDAWGETVVTLWNEKPWRKIPALTQTKEEE